MSRIILLAILAGVLAAIVPTGMFTLADGQWPDLPDNDMTQIVDATTGEVLYPIPAGDNRASDAQAAKPSIQGALPNYTPACGMEMPAIDPATVGDIYRKDNYARADAATCDGTLFWEAYSNWGGRKIDPKGHQGQHLYGQWRVWNVTLNKVAKDWEKFHVQNAPLYDGVLFVSGQWQIPADGNEYRLEVEAYVRQNSCGNGSGKATANTSGSVALPPTLTPTNTATPTLTPVATTTTTSTTTTSTPTDTATPSATPVTVTPGGPNDQPTPSSTPTNTPGATATPLPGNIHVLPSTWQYGSCRDGYKDYPWLTFTGSIGTENVPGTYSTSVTDRQIQIDNGPMEALPADGKVIYGDHEVKLRFHVRIENERHHAVIDQDFDIVAPRLYTKDASGATVVDQNGIKKYGFADENGRVRERGHDGNEMKDWLGAQDYSMAGNCHPGPGNDATPTSTPVLTDTATPTNTPVPSNAPTATTTYTCVPSGGGSNGNNGATNAPTCTPVPTTGPTETPQGGRTGGTAANTNSHLNGGADGWAIFWVLFNWIGLPALACWAVWFIFFRRRTARAVAATIPVVEKED